MDIVVAVFIAILLALLTALLLLRLIRRKGETRLGTFGTARAEMQIKEQLDELLLQIQEVSREHVAKMDTKIRMLGQLIADADKRKAELEELLRRSPAPDAPREVPEEKPARPPNPDHDEIYTLRDQGKSSAEISSITGRDIGEVELILGLREVK